MLNWNKYEKLKRSVEPTQYGKTRVHLEEPNLNDLDSGMSPFQRFKNLFPEGELSDSPEATIQHTYADCLKGCEILLLPLDICRAGCLIDPYGSQPHSQISGKLATTANNLLIESEQLLSMADSLELMGI